MPDRQYHLTPVDFLRGQTIKLLLRPLFGEEGVAKNDDAEAGIPQAPVYGAAQAVSYLQFKFAIP